MNIVSALNYAEHNKGCVFLPIWNGFRSGNLQFVQFQNGHFVMNFNGVNHAWIPSWIDIRSTKWDVITKAEIENYKRFSDIVQPTIDGVVKYEPGFADVSQSDSNPNLETLLADDDIEIDIEHIEAAALKMEAESNED